MRTHRLWTDRTKSPVFRGRPKILDELEFDPDCELIIYMTKIDSWSHEFIQYCQSFEELQECTLVTGDCHTPTMKWTIRIIRESDAVDVCNEPYVMRGQGYKTIYHNSIPVTGRRRVSTFYPATGFRKTANGRLGQTGNKDDLASEGQ